MMINTIEEAISRLRYIQLDTDFTPEQIVHMVLGSGPSQPIYNVADGVFLPAVEFLCRGSRDLPGYPIAGGLVKEDAAGRPIFAAGTKNFPANMHENEFLGLLSVAQVSFKGAQIVTEKGNQGTLADMAEAAMKSYPQTADEPGWSLMLFSEYPGVAAEWHNDRGELQSVDRILVPAIHRPYGRGANLGTSLLAGIACAVSRYCMYEDVEPDQLKGVWQEAYDYLQGAIERMQQTQKDDGSIDRCWFRAGKIPRSVLEWKEKLKDWAARRNAPAKAIVYPTGYCLDAVSPLAMFFGNEREWVDYACYIVAKTVESDWLALVREIPALAHAVHALKLLGKL